ncbi:MAG: hypothetical protein WAV38_23405, partial [Xanthobacteraceae bacterium]
SPFRPALLYAPSTHALCGRSSKIQRRKLIRRRQPAAHELMGVSRSPASSAPGIVGEWLQTEARYLA